MNTLIYTVLAEFDDPAVRDDFERWLLDDHVAKVLHAGARSAEICRLDPQGPKSPPAVEIRYRFASRSEFDTYLSERASDLRAEGLARFGPERGVRMSRRIGELLTERQCP